MTETISKLLTAEELSEMPLDERCELVRGVLVMREKPHRPHGYTAAQLTFYLRLHLETNPVGVLFAETGYTVERRPDTVRAPDISIITFDRLGPDPRIGYVEMAPDLAVEVLSPSNRPAEMAEKMAEYFANGTRLVWLVDPAKRTVAVHAPDALPYMVGDGEMLDGGDVLPGFRVRTSSFFGYPTSSPNRRDATG